MRIKMETEVEFKTNGVLYKIVSSNYNSAEEIFYLMKYDSDLRKWEFTGNKGNSLPEVIKQIEGTDTVGVSYEV